MQVFSRGDSGLVVTLDAVLGKVVIKDYMRTCAGRCPSVPLSTFAGKTTLHTMKVTFGAAGKLEYTVRDAGTNNFIISYAVSGTMGSSLTS